MKTTPSQLDKFEKIITPKISIHLRTGCWLWKAGRDTRNKPVLYWNDKTNKAHRVIYEVLVGEVPEGLVLDHLCRDQSCVNPDHLEAVTSSENALRGDTGYHSADRRNLVYRESSQRKVKDECKNGHPYTELNTYVRTNGDRECRECRREQARKCRDRKFNRAA